MNTLSHSILASTLALFAFSSSCTAGGDSVSAAPDVGSDEAPTAGTGPAPSQEETQTAPASSFDHTHALWNSILQEDVHGDAFDYAALAADRADFDSYLAALHAVTAEELASWSREQRFAFWINAYNAHTIQRVIDHYPIKSIRKLDKNLGLTTVFEQAFIPMSDLNPSGKRAKLSLNDIEHGILRERFKDARVHAAVNCASASCPPLRAEAFVADRLEAQLDEQMRAFVNDRTRNKIDPAKKKMRLSAIFDWFKEDFQRDAGSVRDFLKKWTPEEKHATIDSADISFKDYDWDLNDIERD